MGDAPAAAGVEYYFNFRGVRLEPDQGTVVSGFSRTKHVRLKANATVDAVPPPSAPPNGGRLLDVSGDA